LHQFFKSRFGAIGKPLSALNPANDYDEYLGHIQQAIAELENEPERPPSSADHMLSKSINSDSTASRKREHQVDADEESYILTSSKRRRHGPHASPKRVTAFPSLARPKRSTAKYD